MAIYLSNRDGLGQTNEQGHFKFPTVLFDGAVVGPDSAKVTQNSPLGMSVLIAPGDFKIDTTGDYAYTGWLDANATVVITTADPANPRIDAVVLYVDKGAATSPSPSNNPGIIKTMAIAGTPGGVPSAPNDAAIQSAVGAGNPFIRLANVTVAAAVTQITNASIADTRVLVTLTNGTVAATSLADGAVTTAKLADSAVTPIKRSGGFKIGHFSITTTGLLPITGVGFRPKLVRFSWRFGDSITVASMMSGAMDENGSQYVVVSSAAESGPQAARATNTNACIRVIASDSTTSVVVANYVSMDADGFTINVPTAASTQNFSYEAFA